jgi:hypothetical protein
MASFGTAWIQAVPFHFPYQLSVLQWNSSGAAPQAEEDGMEVAGG